MTRRILPGSRSGTVTAPPSKSAAHRLLICAALSREESRVRCRERAEDVLATVRCLQALGAEIEEEGAFLRVRPIRTIPQGERLLPCGESGATLRLLLPLVGGLGVRARFLREGRLPQRPLSPLDRELCAHGLRLSEEGTTLCAEGRLRSGDYRLPGNVSSQFVSGLLLALPLLEGESRLRVEGAVESAAYIRLTEEMLCLAGVSYEKEKYDYRIPGGQRPALSGDHLVEGDWSGAAPFLCMGALNKQGLRVRGLRPDSRQADRALPELLRGFGAEVLEDNDGVLVRRGKLSGQRIDAAQIPDLVPVLAVLAAGAEGDTRIVNAGRLRLKESDRLKSTAALLLALGGAVEERGDGLVIRGGDGLRGGTAESFGDHRIAMAAALAACLCREPVELSGAECVAKSYPSFWEDLGQLEEEQR